MEIFAVESFEPDTPLGFTEKWRWHELELLNQYKLIRGTEALDGTLYFTTDHQLVHYDGYECHEYSYPSNSEDFRAFQLFASKNTSLYMTSSQGLFSFKGGQWVSIDDQEIESDPSRTHFTQSPYGLEFVALVRGLFQIDGMKLKRIPQVTESTNEIAFDKSNRLWINPTLTNEIISYQFTPQGIEEPIKRRYYKLPLSSDAYPHLITSPYSEEVWATNWKQTHPAHLFDSESDEWTKYDFSLINGTNQHTTGFRISEKEMALFSKSGMLIQSGDKWHSIEYPEFNAPSNNPFYFVRGNGNLIIGGYGEKTYEIEYSHYGQDSYNGLHFLCNGDDGRKWFLSVGGAIVERDEKNGVWLRHVDDVIDTPTNIFRASDGTIWASGSHNGDAATCYYDGDKWTRNQHPELAALISNQSSRQLSNGDIIFGSGDDESYNEPNGAVIYRKTNKGYSPTHYPFPTFPRRPIGVTEGTDGTLFIGGFNLSQTADSYDTPYSEVKTFDEMLWVDHVVADYNDSIWIAAWGDGAFNLSNNQWTNYTAPNQIASDQVCYILSDKTIKDSIWFSTNKGISRFDGTHWFPNAMPKEIRFSREGGTLIQDNEGSIWVNMAKRDWYFRKTPSYNITRTLYDNFKTIRYKLNEDPPIVHIKSYDSNATSPANMFVEWEGIDKWSHTPSYDLKYSYRINDGKWSEFSKRTSTVLLDIDSGHYNIELRSMDTDGNISVRPDLAQFHVIPPVWRRTWFLCLVVATILIIVTLILMLFRQRIRSIIEMDEFKLQFFTNISHELRTPLTVILGPIESQLQKLPDNWDKKPLELAYRNANKTLNLINQILDFRSLETATTTLNISRSDIVASARECLALITPLADEQSQDLEFKCEHQQFLANYDAEKFDRILNNLVSNAIKYTHEFGIITVSLKTKEYEEITFVTLTVEDNGRGIPSKSIENIFKSFYRAKNSNLSNSRGSGIGLAYTKSIVEAYSGTITAESPVTNVNGQQQGSRFIVKLPLPKERPNSSKIEFPIDADSSSTPDESENGKPTILIAEDDKDIREFLSSELSSEYTILTVPNGQNAFDLATAQIPDLVVTDVMMPQIDGKELCRKLKEHALTSHIPTIILTALKSDRHELEGLDAGADDYLTKPVRIPILRKRIFNQLESRRKLHERFSQQKEQNPADIKKLATNDLDEKFLGKANDIVQGHIEDSLFDVELFSTKMGMSRMTLYRKFKAVTGSSPSSFIRSIRMKNAANLLHTQKYNITEIAIMVGFNDLSYFSTTFKKHFNKSPSEYAKENNLKTRPNAKARL